MAEPMRAMNVKLSALTQAYGIDLWLWSPVMAEPGEDVTTPEGKAIALEKRRQLFKDYPSITHVFVPGGDDGNTPAKDLMPFLEELAPILHEYHPNAKIWVSNQTFTLEENDYFFDYLRKEDPQWLHGFVYGPWVKMAWEEMRERTRNGSRSAAIRTSPIPSVASIPYRIGIPRLPTASAGNRSCPCRRCSVTSTCVTAT